MPLIDRVVDRVRVASGSLHLLFGAGLALGELTHVLATRFAERPAIATTTPTPGLPHRVRTYAMLEKDVARLAAAYEATGIRAGLPVAIVCANRIDILLHVLALSRVGAVPLPLNHRWSAEEQAASMAIAGARAIVADADVAAPLLALEPGVRAWWTGAGGVPPAPGRDVSAWLRAHPRSQLSRMASTVEGEAVMLLATSGTTGRPKLARITSRALLGTVGRLHALPVGHQRGLRAGRDVVLATLPLTHVMGLATVLGALCAGVKIIHLDQFDAMRVLARIESDQPNVFVGVPTMYADLEAAGAARRDLSSIELWVSAADVMAPDRARRFQQYGALERVGSRRLGTAALVDVYGMVELAGPAAFRLYPPAPRRRALPPVGFVLPGFQARVVGPDGRTRRTGAAGQLQFRGRGVFLGYVGRDGAEPDAWFSTGDVARLGPGGTFALVGRSADRLKVGGFSVFPAEVEEELRGHPAVAELALVGVPDARLGEMPVVVVVPRGAFDADSFLAWAASRVAPYRRPRAVVRVAALPLGGNDKIDRRAASRTRPAAADRRTRVSSIRPAFTAPARRAWHLVQSASPASFPARDVRLHLSRRTTPHFLRSPKPLREQQCGARHAGPPRARHAMRPWEKICCAVDFSAASDAALAAAAELARRLDAVLVLVHVHEETDTARALDSQPEVREEALRQHEFLLADREHTAAAIRGARVATALLEGHPPAERIAAFADEQGCDLLVMGATHRTLFGGTADKLVRRARCPVLVVPPESHK